MICPNCRNAADFAASVAPMTVAHTPDDLAALTEAGVLTLAPRDVISGEPRWCTGCDCQHQHRLGLR